MKRLLIATLLTLGLLPFFGPAPPVAGPPAPANMKIASNLGLLLSLQREGMQVSSTTPLGRELARIQTEGVIEVSARFTHELSVAERAQIEALGAEFQRVAGRLARMDRFYGLLVPVDGVDDLAAHPLTEWLEATWRPVVPAPLDVSLPAINAPAAWQVQVSTGFTAIPLTGKGVTIANFDTGVDVRHPAFLDGSDNMWPDECNWDSSGDGFFTPGVDKFPLASGVLRYWDAQGDPNNTAGFDVTQDWVYQDDNPANGVYDYAEYVFMAYDADADGVLEAGECLRARGILDAGIPGSKIAATLNSGGVQRTRSVDLELTAADTNGHGTGVSGILVAGNALRCAPGWMSCGLVYPNTRRYTGVAPNADLVVADRYNNAETVYIPWAAGLGAKVMLYEYGGWVGEYLDGSSNHEQMMDAASATGAVQVVPTGNLHGGGRHLQYYVPVGTLTHPFNVPAVGITQIWASMLWLTPGNNMTITLTTPTGGPGNTVALPCVIPGSGWQWLPPTSDGHTVGCERAVDSSRGTALYNIQITRGGGVATGNWTMVVSNPGSSAELTNFYIADDATTWSGGAAWVNASGLGAEMHTAAWPSTCDTCIGVASYATRGRVDGTTVGDISPFSGRGPRFFDNAQVVDVTAPGHYDIISTESKDSGAFAYGKYQWFGGTSAAGPHVAGVAALLMQFARNDADPADIGAAIQQGAVSDGFTGATPNDTWGYGKLDAYGALQNTMHDLGDAPDSSNHFGVSMSAYPGAYPGVQANFPTVYTGTTPLEPHGPMHWRAGSLATGPIDSCLGWSVSAEGEADQGFDEEASNNINPTTDTPNGESGIQPFSPSDDGLWNPGVFVHCVTKTLSYQLTLTNVATSPHYVNLWFDWNRDGDWGDVFTCTEASDAPEWVVQDQVVTHTTPGLYTMNTTTFLPYQPADSYDPLWFRITLSEQPVPLDPLTGRADGRGPAEGYEYGETEDYYWWHHPVAGFEVATTTTCVSYTVTFTNTSYGSKPITYTWDFGDGATIITTTFIHPTHHYTQSGMYRVDLNVIDFQGMSYQPAWRWLNVNSSPTAGFASNTPVLVNETVVFTNTSVGATAYRWDFGDGISTSTQVSPTYVYTSAGTYTVILTATNDEGCLDIYSDVVTVLPLCTPVSGAGFTFAPSSPRMGEMVTFTGTVAITSTPPITYTWDFGDGSATRVDNPITHTFPLTVTAQTCTVTLTVSNTCPSQQMVEEVITVQPLYVYLPLVLRSYP